MTVQEVMLILSNERPDADVYFKAGHIAPDVVYFSDKYWASVENMSGDRYGTKVFLEPK